MASSDLELEVKQLKEKNNEMVLKVQFWKMKAAEQETEKLNLMKEINDLRLKVIRMRNGGAVQARALDSALQATSEEALSHLVQASSAVARTLELAKNYMKDRQELESTSSRWSNLSATPGKDKVLKVAPTLMGGRTTQPFVSLRRVSLSNTISNLSNQNTNERVLPLPMHILQDVYIPLRRIDQIDYNNDVPDADNNSDNEAEDLMLEDSTENPDDSQNLMESDNFDVTRQLEVLHEEIEESNGEIEQVPVNRIENPLEGPSWLLDNIQHSSPVLMKSRGNKRVTLEADSTTEPDESGIHIPSPVAGQQAVSPECSAPPLSRHVFTPTVRRRKRTSSPVAPPDLPCPPDSIRSRNSARVLKVMVPKMRLEYLPGGVGGGGDCSPGGPAGVAAGGTSGGAGSKRSHASLAPSPHGATDSALLPPEQDRSAGEPSNMSLQSNSSTLSRDRIELSRERDELSRDRDELSRDSDSGGEGPSRVRRARKQVQYKEKPLNRKLRR